MENALSSVLSRISNWTPQATQQEVDRLYITTKMALGIERLREGTSWLILGRKGIGKSALAHKFGDSLPDNVIYRKSDFDPNTLFHRLSFFGENVDVAAADKIFKLDILLLAAAELQYRLPERDLSKDARNISRYYSNDVRKLRRRTINTIERVFSPIGRFFGLGSVADKISATGIFKNIGLIDQEFESVKRKLAALYRTSRDAPAIYIVFDEIDLKMDGYRNSDAFENYSNVLRSLMSACASFQDIRAEGIKCYPIIVLRDDIFENIGIGDTNKWSRSAVRVEYTKAELRDILRYRIAHEMIASGFASTVQSLPLNKLLARIQATGPVLQNNKYILDAVIERTMYRPRDIVEFYRIMAQRALISENYDDIGASIFHESRPLYAEYLWNEIVDELNYVYDFAHKIDRVIRTNFFVVKKNQTIRNVYVPRDTARKNFVDFCESLTTEGYNPAVSKLMEDLIRRSVLGLQINTDTGPREFFYFADRVNRDFESSIAISLHRGLADYFVSGYKSQTRRVIPRTPRNRKRKPKTN